MVFQALLSTTTSSWFGTGSTGAVSGGMLTSAAKESPVSGLRPVDISSARTFTNLPEQAHREDESSLFESCAQRLQDWETEDEVAPLWTGQRNYGTFIRPRYGTHRVQNQPQKAGTCGTEKQDGQKQQESCIVHEVAKNDTIQALAIKYNVLVSDILSVNGVTRTAGSSLLVRKTIKIPRAEHACLADHVKPGGEATARSLAVSEKKKQDDENRPPSLYKDNRAPKQEPLTAAVRSEDGAGYQ